MYRHLKINRTGRLWKEIRHAYLDVLEGVVLVVDPSIGSVSSQPGFAIMESGIRTECGIIEIDHRESTHDRLYALGHSLREEFDAVDVLVVEDIPLRRFNQFGRGSLRQQVQLHRAVGAIHASVKATHSLAVHPATWHCVVPPDYVKSDAGDAAAMAEVIRQYSVAYRAYKEAQRGRRKKK